eukprot:scaffold6454_cov113-Isochrysis_galbana.AAC.5
MGLAVARRGPDVAPAACAHMGSSTGSGYRICTNGCGSKSIVYSLTSSMALRKMRCLCTWEAGGWWHRAPWPCTLD